MSFIELTMPPQQEGQEIQKVIALSEQISFAFKQPLDPIFTMAMGVAVLPFIGDYDAVLEQLERAGFTIFETPGGNKAAINPNRVLFYMSPQLGVYSFMFDGKIGMSIKATTAEIKKMFEGEKSNIII